MSRRGVDVASFTLHPAGIPHGPHPGSVEASIGEEGTEELAVMVDTFHPSSSRRPPSTSTTTATPPHGSRRRTPKGTPPSSRREARRRSQTDGRDADLVVEGCRHIDEVVAVVRAHFR